MERMPPLVREVTSTTPLAPRIDGFHHVRLPVSEVLVSRHWYVDILGFWPLLVEEEEEEEDRVTGMALAHPSGVVIGLREEPERARALRGFVPVALSVPDVGAWVDYLDGRAVPHEPLVDGHLGQYLQIPDPDGIIIELHTLHQPSEDKT
jgi:catechol 2,3-dioxygenase-like lactoylglutathione lyase family enzyme